MYTELSHYLLMLAVFLAFNLKHRNLFWIVSLYLVMVTIGFFTAIACYMCSDFSIYNLFTNSNANTPLFFKIAATWSNHEGSLLLWCWLLSVYGFWFCYIVQPWNHSLQSLENEVSYVRQLDPKWVYLRSEKEAQLLQAQALFVYVYILLCFHAFLLTTSNPFLKIPFLCVNSVAELNPVLQDPILAIHPPCIYAGYVASAIGFSLCLSKCIQAASTQHIQSKSIPSRFRPAVFGRLLHPSSLRDKDKNPGGQYSFALRASLRAPPSFGAFVIPSSHLRRTFVVPSEQVYTKTTHLWTELWTLIRVWILICWCFLTIGILLGSWWAYHELGWGGWWFWDPVENASLMPWLLATACIHSVLVPRLNAWTLFLNQFTFVLSILGTLFVRSGLLASVHSFATDSTRGLFILCFLVAIIAISALNLGVYSSDKRGTKLYAQSCFWSSSRSHSSSAGKLLLQKRSEQYFRLRSAGAKGFSTSHCKSSGTSTPSSYLRRTLSLLRAPPSFGAFVIPSSHLRRTFQAACFMRRCSAGSEVKPGSAGCSLKLGRSEIAAPKVRIKALKHFVPADASSSFGAIRGSIADSSIPGTVRATSLLNEPKFVVAQRSNRIVTRIEQLLQMQNGCFLLICVVVLCGTAAPILFQALLERDVSTGAPFFNGTIVPIFTCVLLLLVYVHFLVYSAVGKRTKRLQLKGLEQGYKGTGYDVYRRPGGEVRRGEEEVLQSLEKVLQSLEKVLQSLEATPPGAGISCVLILMVLHWFLFKHLAGLSCLESAYAVICFVLFCTVILVLSIERSTQTRHEAANVASRLVAFSAQCSKNTITPVGINMQTAHAGIVLFLIGVLVSNRNQTQWTQIMRSGYAVRLGHHICCLRGIDHNYGPTFRSICGNLVVYQQVRKQTPATTTHPIVVANLRQPILQARQTLLGLPQVHSKGLKDRPPGIPAARSTTLEGAQQVSNGLDAADYGRCNLRAEGCFSSALFGSDSFCSAAFFRPLLVNRRLLFSSSTFGAGGQSCASTKRPEGFLSSLSRSDVRSTFAVLRTFRRFAPLRARSGGGEGMGHTYTQFHHAFGMFPEKRFFFSNQELSTTKVAIHTNLFSDIYALIGAGSAETGWFVTIMQLPFIGCIWVGFILASIGGVKSLLTLFSLKRKLNWL